MAKASKMEQAQGKVTTIKRPESKIVEVNQQIREAAYYRAEQRGFMDGDPLEDWLRAEEEVLKTTK